MQLVVIRLCIQREFLTDRQTSLGLLLRVLCLHLPQPQCVLRPDLPREVGSTTSTTTTTTKHHGSTLLQSRSEAIKWMSEWTFKSSSDMMRMLISADGCKRVRAYNRHWADGCKRVRAYDRHWTVIIQETNSPSIQRRYQEIACQLPDISNWHGRLCTTLTSTFACNAMSQSPLGILCQQPPPQVTSLAVALSFDGCWVKRLLRWQITVFGHLLHSGDFSFSACLAGGRVNVRRSCNTSYRHVPHNWLARFSRGQIHRIRALSSCIIIIITHESSQGAWGTQLTHTQ